MISFILLDLPMAGRTYYFRIMFAGSKAFANRVRPNGLGFV